MTWNDHTHSEYASDRHEHGCYDLSGVAEEHHRSEAQGRINAFEHQTPEARQAELEVPRPLRIAVLRAYDGGRGLGSEALRAAIRAVSRGARRS